MNQYTKLIDLYFGKKLKHINFEKSNSLVYEYSNFKSSIYLRIEFSGKFPKELPKIYVHEYEKNHDFYSHVESNGKICYLPTDNILFDIDKPEQLVIECIERALNVVDTWDTEIMRRDFRKEFLSYWIMACEKGYSSLISYSEVRNYFEEWEIISTSKQKMLFRKNDINKDKILTNILGDNYKEDRLNSDEAFYLPLRLNAKLIPPNPKDEINIQTIKKLIDGNLSSSVKKQYKKWLRKNKKNYWIILGIPISSDNIVLIGVFIRNYGKNNPLKKNDHKNNLTPLLIERNDKMYQISRTSQNFSLSTMSVAVIGVGSVGAIVANNLSKMGVSSLTLIDDDSLKSDNISRHLLGFNSLNKNCDLKVDALQEYIELQNPHVSIDVESLSFQKLVNKAPGYFDEIDVIVSCTGDTLTNFDITNFFKDTNKKTVFGWLDPYGIGSHCLVVDNQNIGCYKCLNYGPEGLITNRASFAKEGQYFEKNLASCVSAFVPYNYLSSNSAANLICEGILRLTEVDKIDTNVLISSFGRTKQFLNEGFVLSNRYNQFIKSNEYLESENFHSIYCPVCSKAQ